MARGGPPTARPPPSCCEWRARGNEGDTRGSEGGTRGARGIQGGDPRQIESRWWTWRSATTTIATPSRTGRATRRRPRVRVWLMELRAAGRLKSRAASASFSARARRRPGSARGRRASGRAPRRARRGRLLKRDVVVGLLGEGHVAWLVGEDGAVGVERVVHLADSVEDVAARLESGRQAGRDILLEVDTARGHQLDVGAVDELLLPAATSVGAEEDREV